MTVETKEQTFTRIVDQYQNLIWYLCTDYSLDLAYERDDLFQEVMASIWQSLDKLSNNDSEQQWVYRVATNTLLGFCRRKRRRNTQSLSPIDIDETDAINQFYAQEHYNHLLELIALLPPIDRYIVRSHLDGYKFSEIATQLNMTTQAVAKRYNRNITIIKKQFHETLL